MRINEERTKEMQEVLLNIMQAIHDTCEKHNLKYYLIAGTMLGAVRHNGFIPWDDDVDIALPRTDYDKFIAHANEWLPERYELVCNTNDLKYPYQFARVQDRETTYILRRIFDFVGGVPIDIFPLDGMTENKIARKWHYFRYCLVKKLIYYSLTDPYKHGKGLRTIFINICKKTISLKWANNAINRIQKEFDYDSSSLVADHDNKPSRGILPKEVYGEPKLVDFAGRRFYGVNDPHTYLKYCYNDYMKLPKQLPAQNFRYLDMCTPYREYMDHTA